MDTPMREPEEAVDTALAELIASAIGQAVANSAAELKADMVMDAKGVSEMLTTDPAFPVTERMVNQMATQQGLPGRKVKGRVGWRFTRNSVLEWVANGNK